MDPGGIFVGEPVFAEPIRISLGTAIELGLASSRQEIPPTTAYLLWDPGCRGSCSFCPRAGGESGSALLSRVIWPEFPLGETLRCLRNKPGRISRICLQTGWNPDSEGALRDLVDSLRSVGMPLSVTLHPAQVELAAVFLDGKVDHVGIGLDVASPETYSLHKGRAWDADLPGLFSLVKRFPRRVEVHLIVGLGDSEETIVRLMAGLISAGGMIALFAFTPVPRAKGGKNGPVPHLPASPPDLGMYRRIQIARHLLERGVGGFDGIRFGDGRVVGVAPEFQAFFREPAAGEVFRTSGCGDCNRPFYNERPGGIPFNFPRPLTRAEYERCLGESELDLGFNLKLEGK